MLNTALTSADTAFSSVLLANRIAHQANSEPWNTVRSRFTFRLDPGWSATRTKRCRLPTNRASGPDTAFGELTVGGRSGPGFCQVRLGGAGNHFGDMGVFRQERALPSRVRIE